MEEWREVIDYPEYFVSNLGNVRRNNKSLKPETDRWGYLRVNLCKNNIRKHKLIHRLVGFAFISNPNNNLEIDHINRIKNDNNVSNLRWATILENSLNRILPTPESTNEKYIKVTKFGKFKLYIRRGLNFIKTYETLLDAIKARNELLTG